MVIHIGCTRATIRLRRARPCGPNRHEEQEAQRHTHMNPSLFHRLSCKAQTAIARMVRSFPPPLRKMARQVPVTHLMSPTVCHVANGIAPDTLGLFVGGAYPDGVTEPDPMPPQILLFIENLWEEALHSDPAFLEEVRRTYLHEIGHYLGLTEEELTGRDLD